MSTEGWIGCAQRSLFVFRNKGGHLVKILWWDQDGLAIYYDRLERGAFCFLAERTGALRWRSLQRASAAIESLCARRTVVRA